MKSQPDKSTAAATPTTPTTHYHGPVQVFQGNVETGIQENTFGRLPTDPIASLATPATTVPTTQHLDIEPSIDAGEEDFFGWEEEEDGEEDGEENRVDIREPEEEEEGATGKDYFPVGVDQGPKPSAKRPTIADRYSKALLDLDARYGAQSKRWRLASGQYVESILYLRSRVMKPKTFLNSLAPLFVLDTTNKAVKKWFTDPEWQEISESIPPLPEADAYMTNSCIRFFDCKTLEELRNVVDSTCYRDHAEPPDYEKHFDARWADMVVRGMLDLWESPNQPLRTSHLENWFNSYLWSPIVDRCLLSLRDVTVERSEASCQATARRLNQHRQSPDVRALTGPRLDAVVRTIEGDFDEFCGMEIARGYAGGETSTKWLSDTFKLAKVLKDMLHCLHKRVDHDEAICKKLRVVGVICNGLKLQMVRMGHYKGGIAILTKDDPIQVPVGVEGLLNLFVVIAEISRMKAIISESVEAVKRRHHTTKTSHADLVQRMLKGKQS